MKCDERWFVVQPDIGRLTASIERPDLMDVAPTLVKGFVAMHYVWGVHTHLKQTFPIPLQRAAVRAKSVFVANADELYSICLRDPRVVGSELADIHAATTGDSSVCRSYIEAFEDLLDVYYEASLRSNIDWTDLIGSSAALMLGHFCHFKCTFENVRRRRLARSSVGLK